MFVYVDERGRITAFNPNDMSGNSDWHEVPEEVTEHITEEHDVPLYKLKNGHAAKRSAAEIEADIPEPVDPEPTEIDIIMQRLDEQDDALIELAGLIGGE